MIPQGMKWEKYLSLPLTPKTSNGWFIRVVYFTAI